MSTYPNLDGPVEREAFHREVADRYDELDAIEQREQDSRLAVLTPTDAERITELKALLADLAMGADIMLEPAVRVTGAMRSYILEVKRVASAGRAV